MVFSKSALMVVLLRALSATALRAPSSLTSRVVPTTTTSVLRMAATTVERVPTVTTQGEKTETKTLLPRERYVASNRFVTRDNGAAAKFEARWATRKSRLATLDGFKYFTLLRQVPLQDVVGERGAAAMAAPPTKYNYMSFTIWDDKQHFEAWRNGDAFKEAHGGTGIGAFLTAMVSSLQVLKGPPSPVFWDGLLHLSNPPEEDPSKVSKDGWRVVEADGETLLPAECFVAANRFDVRPGAESDFEARWAQRDSNLKDMPGFKSFTMLRRDASSSSIQQDPMGDAWNYMSFTVWKDRASFSNWRNSQAFKDAHGSGQQKKNTKAASEEEEKDSAAEEKPPQPPPWVRPPTVFFWEGVLELTAPEGA